MAVLRALLVAFAVLASAQARTLPIGAQRELPVRSGKDLLAPSPRATRIIPSATYEPLMCADPSASYTCSPCVSTDVCSGCSGLLSLLHVPYHSAEGPSTVSEMARRAVCCDAA